MSKGIGGHQSAASQSDEWLTPPEVLTAVGGADSFDLDPCAPIMRPWPMARDHYTIADNGLLKRWDGRVWFNPPYSEPYLSRFLARMQEHNHGTGLLFARTETQWFFRYVWPTASALLFLEGRLHFHYVDGTRAKANAGAPHVLIAYGMEDAERLGDLSSKGQFVPLLLPRSFAVLALGSAPASWREVLAGIMRQRGPMRLDEIYRAIQGHAKASGRKHWREQVRKVLQTAGTFQRIAPATWSLA